VAAEVVGEICDAGRKAVVCVGSVDVPNFADQFVATAMDKFDGVEIIVNNAGYAWDSVIHKMKDEQFQTILDVNLVAPFRASYVRRTSPSAS
jgi:3-oxoacyl-[acyl-carrier protein] reductase